MLGGVLLFERVNKDFTAHHNFKPTTDAIPHLVPFLGPKRSFLLTDPADLRTLLHHQHLTYHDAHCEAAHMWAKLFSGYIALRFPLLTETSNTEEMKGRNMESAVVCRNGGGCLSLCASSAQVWSLQFLLDIRENNT